MPRLRLPLLHQLQLPSSCPSLPSHHLRSLHRHLSHPAIPQPRPFATIAPASSVPPSTPTTPSPSPSPSPSSPTPRRLALLGAPGVGKGTYARYIGPHYGLPFISTGDLVRAEISSGSLTGLRIREATNRGHLLDDAVILALLTQRLALPDCSAGFLLDGYPRRLSQASALESLYALDLVVNLVLRKDILVRKLSARRVCGGCGRGYNVADINEGEYVMPPLMPRVRGVCDACEGELVQRSDDTEGVVKERLRIYEEETMPLVEFYERQGRLVRFEVFKGVQDVPRLLSTIDQALGQTQQRMAAGKGAKMQA